MTGRRSGGFGHWSSGESQGLQVEGEDDDVALELDFFDTSVAGPGQSESCLCLAEDAFDRVSDGRQDSVSSSLGGPEWICRQITPLCLMVSSVSV